MIMELREAVEDAELWMDMWEDEFAGEEEKDFDREAEKKAILAFRKVISAAKATIPKESEDCPHAAPHRYCSGCKVSPCPIGLG